MSATITVPTTLITETTALMNRSTEMNIALTARIESATARVTELTAMVDAITVRAQALVAENAQLRQERDTAQANYQFMVDRAINQRLDGYRALGERAANAENALDDARARIARLETQLAALGHPVVSF